MANPNQEKLSGLWINKTKSGETYFSGSNDGFKYVIFKNGFKEKENQPDYVLYKEPVEPKNPSNIPF
jgi:hypothetical protein